MLRSPAKSWIVLSALWCGCSLATDFDRSKIPSESGPGHMDASQTMDAAHDSAASDGTTSADSTSDGTVVQDTGMVTDTGPSSECSSNAQCRADQLCCNGMCLATSVASRCPNCISGCDSLTANTCNARACGCDNGPPCSGAKPFCVSNGATSCAECRANLNDCALRADGKTQCVQGACAACDPASNAGCSGATPICDAATLTCKPCSMSPDNCSGNTVCTTSGACGGCKSSGDCATPTTPICNTTANPTVCRACGGDNECMAQVTKPYCVNDGRCATCKPVSPGVDLGCDVASATPACKLNASGQYQCQRCANSNDCAGNGSRNTCSNGRCVQCQSGLDCGPDKPYCDASGMCQPCVAATDGDVFCLQNTLGGRPYCDASGRCTACTATKGCTGAAPNNSCLLANNPSQNSCVDCIGTIAGECAAGAPVCDTARHACVKCLAPSNQGCTGATPVCRAGQSTNQNECVQCTVVGDCPAVNCKTAMSCTNNACVYVDKSVDDGFSCTTDACNPTTGVITHTAVDGMCPSAGCLMGKCLGAGGAPVTGCGTVPVVCDAGVCDPEAGVCM